MIKNLLAGARAVSVASVLYKKGPAAISEMKAELLAWMKQRRYHTIQEFRGRLSHQKMEDPSLYERVQFMKTFSNHRG